MLMFLTAIVVFYYKKTLQPLIYKGSVSFMKVIFCHLYQKQKSLESGKRKSPKW